jgi:hypothetical protein
VLANSSRQGLEFDEIANPGADRIELHIEEIGRVYVPRRVDISEQIDLGMQARQGQAIALTVVSGATVLDQSIDSITIDQGLL